MLLNWSDSSLYHEVRRFRWSGLLHKCRNIHVCTSKLALELLNAVRWLDVFDPMWFVSFIARVNDKLAKYCWNCTFSYNTLSKRIFRICKYFVNVFVLLCTKTKENIWGFYYDVVLLFWDWFEMRLLCMTTLSYSFVWHYQLNKVSLTEL